MLSTHADGTKGRPAWATRQMGATLVAVASIAFGATGCSGDKKETTTAAPAATATASAAPSASAALELPKEIAATAAVIETENLGNESDETATEPVTPEDLAAGVTEQLVGQFPGISVECPDELESKVGATATCVATLDNETENLKITVTSIVGQTVNFDIKSA
jgi:hypothetical protein